MTVTERLMRVPPDAVWETLARAGTYADWVVGAQAIRAVDPTWPEPGSRFHHRIGVGPLMVFDHSEVLEAVPGRLLRFRGKARPLAIATVTFELEPADGGTRVRMTQELDGPYRLYELNPLVPLLTRARNARSLANLERVTARRRDAAGR
jgi:uncharacterized protein YndB with AHSA1/START domain